MPVRQRIETDKAPPSTGFRSQALAAAGFLFTGGQIGAPLLPGGRVRRPADTLEEQVALCLAHLEQVTLAGGGSLERVCEVSAFVVPGERQDEVRRQVTAFLGFEPPLYQSQPVADVAMHGMLELDWAVLLDPDTPLEAGARTLAPFMHGEAVARSGPFLCFNGVSAPGASMAEQSEGVLDRLEELLAAEGAAPHELVKLAVFLADFDAYPEFNEATKRRFARVVPPTRSVLVAPDVTGDALLRVDALALRPEGR